MLQLMRDGGIPMVVILLFGAIGLVAAALFARRPEPHKVRFLAAMGLATLFAILSGTAADLAKVCTTVANHEEWSRSPEIHLILLQGLSESMAPSVLGFTLLSLTAFVTAIGFRRMPRS
jgi:hypothetical protein